MAVRGQVCEPCALALACHPDSAVRLAVMTTEGVTVEVLDLLVDDSAAEVAAAAVDTLTAVAAADLAAAATDPDPRTA